MATWLVVGLGNPGPTYASHRHNVGAMVVDELARRGGASFSTHKMLKADTAEVRIGAAGTGAVGEAHRVILARTRTYMNESGVPVKNVLRHHHLEPDHLVVVHDELDLDAGRLRCKFGGGDNGHNGLKSIRSLLGTGDYFRVRIGIGRPPGRQDPADWVLSSVPKAQLESQTLDIVRAADAVELIVWSGLDAAQQRLNG